MLHRLIKLFAYWHAHLHPLTPSCTKAILTGYSLSQDGCNTIASNLIMEGMLSPESGLRGRSRDSGYTMLVEQT